MQHPFSPRPCWKVAPHTGSGFPGSRWRTSPALLRPALQHRKVAVRSPRPTPRTASDMLWARSRQGPHSEKVMPVPAAPASTARAPKGGTQRDQEAPAPPVAKNRVCRAPGGSGDARPGRVGSGKDSGDLMFPTRWPCSVWGGDGVAMVRMPTTALGHILICHVRANWSRT